MKTLLHRDELHYGGFAGLREHRLVMHSKAFAHHKDPATADGIGSFLYLSDAKFNPHGETHMHPHKEVDVISLMLEGSINHEGTLEHGATLHVGDVQVQRAGGEGFSHNEINPDDKPNRMIQLWFAPEIAGQKADYQVFKKNDKKVQRVYGGHQGGTFESQTVMEIVNLKKGDSHHYQGLFQAYLTKGSVQYSELILKDGDFFSDDTLEIEALEDCQFILITLDN